MAHGGPAAGSPPSPVTSERHDSWQDRVLARLDTDCEEATALLSSLVRTASVTGSSGEHEVQSRLADLLASEGLVVDHWPLPLADLLARDDAPGTEVPRTEGWGLVARLPGTGTNSAARSSAPGPASADHVAPPATPPPARLLLDGHVDVVPPGAPSQWSGGDPWSGSVEGDARTGRLLGRGAADMKGGLVSALAAVLALRRTGAPLAGDVLLACVAGEEDGGLGTYATLARGYTADLCVVPEPTSLDVVPACGGALTFRLRVTGRSAHASRRTEGVSALDKLWPIHRALSHLERARNADVDPLMRRWLVAYPLSLGTVHAGDWASSVPDLLVAEGRLGVALDESVPEARAALERAVAQACAADDWLAAHPVQVEWWGGQFAPGQVLSGSDIVDRVRRAHDAAGAGPAPEVYGAPYGSDLRLLTAAGIPTVHYGPGDAAQAHAADEYVPLEQVHAAARTLAVLALDVCGA